MQGAHILELFPFLGFAGIADEPVLIKGGVVAFPAAGGTKGFFLAMEVAPFFNSTL